MAEKKPKTYKYILEMSQSMYPRHLADYLTMLPMMARILLRVTDLNRNDHIYGATYEVGHEEEQNEPMTFRQVVEYYTQQLEQAKRNKLYPWSEDEKLPKEAAYEHILDVLKMCGDGNLGLVDAYMKEYVAVLQEFEMHCRQLGRFAKAKQEGDRNG